MASPLITDKSRSVKSFVWSHYPECGFPARVNHCTVIARNGSDGRDYVYSIGGYYEGEEEEDHNFRSVPIDIHRMDIGKEENSQHRICLELSQGFGPALLDYYYRRHLDEMPPY